jgi:hypothetical protein
MMTRFRVEFICSTLQSAATQLPPIPVADFCTEAEMPEKSRGRRGKDAVAMDKSVSFADEMMDFDDKFEELTKPMYKGKRIDEPIPNAVVIAISVLTSDH